MHWGPSIIEKSNDDIAVRLMLVESKPNVLCLELNSIATYNMMDPLLSNDLSWATEAAVLHIKRTHNRAQVPLAIEVQGAGPHFCPGGNPDFASRFAADVINMSTFDKCQYLGYAPFSRIRELAVPTVQGSHGAQVGGGNAYALNHMVRVCAHSTTISFGNLSRGAVPGMMLSQTLPHTIGFLNASTLYLLDLTLSAYGAVKADFMTRIFNGPREAKAGATMIARSLAAYPGSHRACPIIYPFEAERFAVEGFAIDFSGRSGDVFKNVKTKTVNPAALDLEDLHTERGGPRRRARAMGRLAAKAGALHGAGIEGGIIAVAQYVSNCCWVSMVEDANLQGHDGYPAKYASESLKVLHKPVQDLAIQNLGLWQSPANRRGMRKIDVWQVAEVVAFCLWRDRNFSVEVVEVKTETALSQLENIDFRRQLLRGRWAVEADAAVPAITVKHRSNNGVHFEDPLKRFGSRAGADIWWQFIAMHSGRQASMLLLAALLGAVSDPRILLTCEGEEVQEFSHCCGKYVGPIKQLALKDVTTVPAQLSLDPRADSKHDWFSIRTVSGRETCVDIAAAQFGDATRSECSGVPVVFMPGEQFQKRYVEQRRDKDPLKAYSEEFVNLLNAREKEGPGRMEEFFSVLGKTCALLGLV
jgi:enoyl-CoA hydratase/carnithine racemase